MKSRRKSLVHTVLKLTDKSKSEFNESDIELDIGERLSELLKSAEKDQKEKLAEANNNIEMTPDAQVNDRKHTSINHRNEN